MYESLCIFLGEVYEHMNSFLLVKSYQDDTFIRTEISLNIYPRRLWDLRTESSVKKIQIPITAGPGKA